MSLGQCRSSGPPYGQSHRARSPDAGSRRPSVAAPAGARAQLGKIATGTSPSVQASRYFRPPVVPVHAHISFSSILFSGNPGKGSLWVCCELNPTRPNERRFLSAEKSAPTELPRPETWRSRSLGAFHHRSVERRIKPVAPTFRSDPLPRSRLHPFLTRRHLDDNPTRSLDVTPTDDAADRDHAPTPSPQPHR